VRRLKSLGKFSGELGLTIWDESCGPLSLELLLLGRLLTGGDQVIDMREMRSPTGTRTAVVRRDNGRPTPDPQCGVLGGVGRRLQRLNYPSTLRMTQVPTPTEVCRTSSSRLHQVRCSGVHLTVTRNARPNGIALAPCWTGAVPVRA